MAWIFSFQGETSPVCVETVGKLLYTMVKGSGAREQPARDLQAAVDVALLSVHRHTYGNRVGLFHVDATFDAGAWSIVIADEGRSSRSSTTPLIRSFGKWKKGLSPIASLVDEFTIHIDPKTGRLTFRMKKTIVRS